MPRPKPSSNRKGPKFHLEFNQELAGKLGIQLEPLDPAKRSLTPAQAALVLGMTRPGLVRWIKIGQLKATLGSNGYWSIAPADLEAHLHRRSSPPKHLILCAPSAKAQAQFAGVLSGLEVEATVSASATDAWLKAGSLLPSAVVLPADEPGFALAQKIRSGSITSTAILLYAERDLTEAETDRALELRVQGCLRLPATDAQVAESIRGLVAGAPRTKVVRS